MSAADVFMSSPPRPANANLDPYSMSSSSPYLPPLDELLSKSPKKPPLRSGNHVAPIPANARTSFTSAASLLREAPEIDIETEQITNSPPRKPKPTRSRKKKAATPEMPNTNQIEVPIVIESSSPDDKPWHKFKSKKSPIQDEQPSLPRSRMTKANPKLRAKAETVSRHFSTKADNVQREDKKTEECKITQEGKHHSNAKTATATSPEPAVARRIDWTPSRIENPMFLGSDSDSRELLSSIDKTMVSKEVFQSLFDKYGRKDSTLPVVTTEHPQPEFLKKRKQLELVSTTNAAPAKGNDQQPREASPSKAPAVKKKARTITDLATAPYALPTEPDLDLAGPATKESLLTYFDSDGAVKALVEHQTAVMSQKQGKAKAPKKPAKPKRKKKGTVEQPILLSPSSALKQTTNQDFVFGTSSQLVREDSPTTLRDLQMAIQASNQVDSDDPFADSDSQGLWRVGARDVDGELMDVEVVDLQHTSSTVSKPQEDAQSPHQDFPDIDDILKSPEVSTSSKPQKSEFVQSQPPSSAQPPEPSDSEAAASDIVDKPGPNYELFTDAQLAKQITSYGFKPVKKRQAMIALLDQCWTSKNSGATMNTMKTMATTTTPTSPKKKAATSATTKPAKPRGRPKKSASAEAPASISEAIPKSSKALPKKRASTEAPEAPVDASEPSPKRVRGRPKKTASKTTEIADSDMEDTNSLSPVSSPDRVFSSPPPLDLSTTDEADMSLTLSPTDQQAHLFKHITKAVTSAPRSQDPSTPSWHEKMLLYDPIVLEEFAAWLNGGELTRVGYDNEVSPFDVKKWCESKSVICLWQQTLKGKERKRY